MKRSPIAPTSKKRAALLRQRKKLTDAMQENGPVMCEFPVRGWGVEGPVDGVCNRRADDLHEPGKRSQGADPSDAEQTIPLCRTHHDWTHEHPREAAELGLLHSKKFGGKQ